MQLKNLKNEMEKRGAEKKETQRETITTGELYMVGVCIKTSEYELMYLFNKKKKAETKAYIAN